MAGWNRTRIPIFGGGFGGAYAGPTLEQVTLPRKVRAQEPGKGRSRDLSQKSVEAKSAYK